MTAAVADVLDRAADLLVERGWWGDGAFLRGEDPPEGALCTYLALYEVTGGCKSITDTALDDAMRAFARHLPRPPAGDDPWPAITRWNDRKCRTASGVILALRLAAIRERPVGSDIVSAVQQVAALERAS